MSEETCPKCGKPRSECTCNAITATVVVQGKDEIKRLETENADLNKKLELISERAFSNAVEDVAQKLHLTAEEKAEIKTTEDLEKLKMCIEERERAHDSDSKHSSCGGAFGRTPLSDDYGYSTIERDKDGKIKGNWREAEYSTQEEMVSVLHEIAENEKNQYAQDDSDDAKRLLNKLIRKSLASEQKEPSSMTYEGSLKDVVSGKGSLEKWKKTSVKEAQEGE